MFNYKVTDPKTGRVLTISFKRRPTKAELDKAVLKVLKMEGGEEKREADGVIDAVKDYGVLFQGGFQKGMLDLYAMGISRPAGKLAGLFGDKEGAQYYEQRAQAFSQVGQELMQEALDKAENDTYKAKIATALGGMVPVVGSTLLTKDPTKALALASGTAGVQTAGSDNYRYLEIEAQRLQEEEGLGYQEARDKAAGRVLMPSLASGAKTAGITAAGGFAASKLGLAGVETGAAVAQVARTGLTGTVARGLASNSGYLPAGAKQFMGSLALEGVEEGLDSLASSGIDWSEGFDPDMTLGKAVTQAADDFIVGLGAGGVIQGTREGLDKYNQRKERKAEERAAAEERVAIEEEARALEEQIARDKEDFRQQILDSEIELADKLPAFKRILESSAHSWAKRALNDENLTLGDALDMPLSRIERRRKLSELEGRIDEARQPPEHLETAQQKSERKAIVSGLETEHASILSGETVIHPPAVQSVLDSYGVKTVEEAFDILTGKAEPPSRTEMTVSKDAPEVDAGPPIEAEEAPVGSKASDVLPETFEVPSTPLKTAKQAKAARRAEEPFVDSPKTAFEQAQTPPEILAPDPEPKGAELPSIDMGSGVTRAEQAAMDAGPLASAEQLGDLRSGRRKKAEQEQRRRGTVKRYDTPDKEVIISNAVESADVSGTAPVDEVSNVIKGAEAEADAQNINLSPEDKIEILDRVDARAEEVENSTGDATIQDGLEMFSDQLNAIKDKIRKATRGKLGANLGLFTETVKAGLDAAILAAKAGVKLSDVIDIGTAAMRKNLKGKKLSDSDVNRMIDELAKYIHEQSEVTGKPSEFNRKSFLSARRSKALKRAAKDAGLDLNAILPDPQRVGKGQTFARVNINSHMFGNISGEWGKGDASSVLKHIGAEFTGNTTPTRPEVVELLRTVEGEAKADRAVEWMSGRSQPKLGELVNGRISIPIVRATAEDPAIGGGFQKYVAAITKNKKSIGYDNIFVVDSLPNQIALEVRSKDAAALDIAEGYSKSGKEVHKTTIAYVNGGYVQASINPDGSIDTLDASGKQETITAEDLHDSRKFLQIAMNPKRANYWYSRSTGRRIVSVGEGARMYQIGGTVFVKKDGSVVTDGGNPAALVRRLKRAQRAIKDYISRRRGSFNSLPIDILAARLANASLEAAIQSIVYGGMAVDAAIKAAYNALDHASRNQVDFDTFNQHLGERLNVAIQILDISGSEKAAIEVASSHFAKPSMAEAEVSEVAEEKVKDHTRVLNEQEDALITELSNSAPLSLGTNVLADLFRGSFNNIVRATGLGLTLLSQRIKIALAKRAKYEGSYRLLDVDGDEITYISEEQDAEVTAYRLARAEGKPLPEISDLSMRLVEEIDRVFLLQGDDARQAKVLQRQEDGSYKVGKFNIGEGGYYHRIKKQYLDAIRALMSGATLSESQRADLNEFIDRMQLRRNTDEKSFEEARKWGEKNISSGTSDAYVNDTGTAPMVRARTVEIPPSVIDLSASAFVSQSLSWAKTLAEIEAYGQNADGSVDIFQQYLKLLNSARFKNHEGVSTLVKFIEEAQKTAYESRDDSAWANAASSRGVRALGRLTSVVMLASVMSGITQLTSLGFIASKAARLKSPMSFVKGFLSAVTSGDVLRGDEVRGLGLVAGAANAMAGNYLDDSAVSRASRGIADLAANYALKLVAIPDQFTRTVNLHQAKYLLEEVKSSIADGVNPDMVREFRLHAERMGLNPDAVLEGDSDAETQYLINSVFEVQGSYRLQQLPAFLRNPAWQALLKFSPFAFQVGSEIAEQVQSAGKESGLNGQIRYLLYTAAILGLTEELRANLFLKLFGRERNVATIEEILSQETVFGAGKLTLGRAWENLLSVGVLGQVGYVIMGNRYSGGEFGLMDFATPSMLKEAYSLYADVQNKKKTPDQAANEFAGRFIKIYRDVKSVGSRFESVREEWEPAMATERRRQFIKIRNIKERYEEDTGINVRSGGGEPTELSKYSRQVSDRLLLGDVAGAREKAMEYAMMSPDRESSWTRLSQSLKQRQPVMAAGFQSKKQVIQFAAWAKDNLSDEDFKDITSANIEFINTALRAGLITRDGETPYPDTLAEMKQAMTGKVPDKPKAPAPLTYRDLIDRRKKSLQIK